jgi:hypothetical protein
LPHSNFHPELEISGDGTVITVGGPLKKDEDDDDLVSVIVSAFVTQEPDRRVSPPAVQQGATGTESVELGHAALTLDEIAWQFTVASEGGPFREDWAFASGDLLGKSSDGAVEKYTWSQWVWLRRP